MIQKIDDSKVTAAGVGAMTPTELKAFENRLRRMAETQGLAITKMKHPYGPRYMVIESERNTIEAGEPGYMNILDVRDYLYGVK